MPGTPFRVTVGADVAYAEDEAAALYAGRQLRLDRHDAHGLQGSTSIAVVIEHDGRHVLTVPANRTY